MPHKNTGRRTAAEELLLPLLSVVNLANTALQR